MSQLAVKCGYRLMFETNDGQIIDNKTLNQMIDDTIVQTFTKALLYQDDTLMAEIDLHHLGQLTIHHRIYDAVANHWIAYSTTPNYQKFAFQTCNLELSPHDLNVLKHFDLNQIDDEHNLAVTTEEFFLISHLRRQVNLKSKGI